MIHIKYRLDKSSHHGIGVFADEDIAKGAVIYTPSPLLDVDLAREEFDSLDEKEKKEVRYWGFFERPTQKWHVDFGVTRLINHSYNGNVTQDPSYAESHLIAARDIKQGEELTQNYLEIEPEDELRKQKIDPKG